MFWKIGKRRKSRPWSITLRLVCIYTLSTFCILLITTLSLYWVFSKRLQRDNYQFLMNKVLLFQQVLKDEPLQENFFREEMLLETKIYHYYVRILDKNNHVRAETPGMSTFFAQAEFPIVHGKKGNFLAIAWQAPPLPHAKPQYFLLTTAPLKNASGDVIQLAKDISVEKDILEDNREGLLLILIIGMVSSTLLGILVTQRGLKPLREIARSTQRVNVAQLKERLDPNTLPREFMPLANEFNAMLERIEEGVFRLATFSADLAHELRTPINTLMVETEITLSRPRENIDYRVVLESNLEELQRISSLIEKLLFLARAENPESVVHLTHVELQPLFSDICAYFESLAEEKNIRLIYHAVEHVKADPTMLRQAIGNLLVNSLKHTSAGGEIQVRAEVKGQFLCIMVLDNGDGIEASHLPHLFSRFYRTDTARSKLTGGMGLGLAIVKSIMGLHKGSVVVESEVGQGTIVSLLFPRSCQIE